MQLAEVVSGKEPVQVWLRFPQLDAIDDWRRRQLDLPSRAEAIRRLTDEALAKNVTQSITT